MRQSFLWALTALTSVYAAATISTTGQCGAANGGLTCAGSTFGSCCSQSVKSQPMHLLLN